MRFLFVDKITERTARDIKGVMHFADDSPFRIPRQGGSWVIAPGVIGEAIGQLVSWLVIERTQFKFRPVFAFSNTVEILGAVPPGTEVQISGHIDQLDDESVVFSGEASAGGQVVQRVSSCTNYFMPIEKTEFEADTRERFTVITSKKGGQLADGGAPFKFASLVQGFDISEDRTMVTAFCRVPVDEPFYRDHFPRFPVTPIVVINEIIGLAIGHLFGGPEPEAIMPKLVKNLKIKSFICPGEDFQIMVKRKLRNDEDCEAIVTVTKEGKKILQGLYIFSDSVVE